MVELVLDNGDDRRRRHHASVGDVAREVIEELGLLLSPARPATSGWVFVVLRSANWCCGPTVASMPRRRRSTCRCGRPDRDQQAQPHHDPRSSIERRGDRAGDGRQQELASTLCTASGPVSALLASGDLERGSTRSGTVTSRRPASRYAGRPHRHQPSTWPWSSQRGDAVCSAWTSATIRGRVEALAQVASQASPLPRHRRRRGGPGA